MKQWAINEWNEKNYIEFVQYLWSIQDIKYQKFQMGIVKGVSNLIGIPVPQLKLIAKEIAAGDYKGFLKVVKHDTYEETMIQGLVIGDIKVKAGISSEEVFHSIVEYTESFLPYVDNWAVCDIFCSALKITKKYKEPMLLFIHKQLKSGEEYKVRFGFVMLLNYYLEEQYLCEIFELCEADTSGLYYIDMAIAWLLSTAYTRFEKETLAYLDRCSLTDFTYQKTLAKIVESNKVSPDKKMEIRKKKKEKR